MSKALTVGMRAHIAAETLTLCRCWQVTRGDGVAFYFTDAAADVTFAGNVYRAATGFESLAVSNESGLASKAVDISGFFDSAAITSADLRAGRFDGAEVLLFLVDWSNPDANGAIKIRRGTLGEVISNPQGAFRVELRSLSQALQQQMGEVASPECRAQLGDARCKVDLAAYTVTGTVGAVTSRGQFVVPVTDIRAVDGWFNGGLLDFTSGNNTGRRMEIRAWVQSTNVVTLFLPVGYLPVPGDTVTLYPGCNKSVVTCRDRFANVVNFRGEPALPGNDKTLMYPGAHPAV